MEKKRRRRSRSAARLFWHGHVEAWKASGLRQVDYCQQQGLSRKSMSLWKRKLAAAGQAPEPSHSQKLIPVIVTGERKAAGPLRRQAYQPDPTHLDIRLPNGVQLALTISDHTALPSVLRELAALTC